MENRKGQARQISACLDTCASNVSSLHTSIEAKAITPIEAGPTQNERNIPGLLDDDHYLVDSGWNPGKSGVLQPLVNGLDNEDIWLLIRRFNKRVFHLKQASKPLLGGLDFHVATEEDFSPNKLTAQLERLYMGLLLGLLILVQHIARVRSWREPRRTATFCLAYFVSWYLDSLMPIMFAFLTVLLVSPKIRRIMFPPAPPALVDHTTGGMRKPAAGLLGSIDSATGAPENIKGEALENEASNFVTGIAAIAINTLIDKDPQHDDTQKGNHMTRDLPSPNALATKVATAKDKAAGVDKPSRDKTKYPMEKIMWSKVRPFMHGICVVSDTWERCANLLAPTTPFVRDQGRYRVIWFMLPVLILSTFVTCHIVYRVASLIIGCCFFGNILLMKTYIQIKPKNFSITNTVFEGIPTDAQLTIALLRLGEAHKAPLLPPPVLHGPPPHEPHPLGDDILGSAVFDEPLGATQEEVLEATSKDSAILGEAGGDDHESTEVGSQGKKRGKLLGVVKVGAKAAAKTIIGIDKIRAKTGSQSAKLRLGAASITKEPPIAGPVEFTCRYDGQEGFVYITTDAKSPCLCFSKYPSPFSSESIIRHGIQPTWVIAIREIVELNKYSGYGAKSKLLAGWALGEEIIDGVEITDHKATILITAVARRDELFNRLCALSSQKWEVW